MRPLRTLLFLLVSVLVGPSLLLAQWSAIGPSGGGATLIAAGSGSSASLVAGTKNALLYRTSDKAATWQSIAFDRSLSATLNALVPGGCNPDEFFAGTSDSDPAREGVYRVNRESGIWSLQPILMGSPVMSIAVAPKDCRVMAAGTLTGIMLTRDGGATWKRIAPAGDLNPQPIVSLAFAPDSTEALYAGTPKLPWKTVDGGATWRSVHVGINDDSDIFSIAAGDGRLLIGACSGIYKSSDGGLQWDKVLGIPGESRRTYVVKASPSDASVIYAGTSNGLWKSTDAGATWVQKTPVPARSVVIDPRNPLDIVMASDVGIWKSMDGAETLTPANSGFVNRKLGAFLDTGGTLLASAVYEVGFGTLFATKDGGKNWASSGDSAVFGEHIFHLIRGSRYVFAAGLESLYRSADEGKTWTKLNARFDGALVDVAPLAKQRKLLVATATDLFVVDEETAQWNRLRLLSAMSRIDGLRISLNGATWGVLSGGDVFLSNDGGNAWVPLSVPEGGGPVRDFTLRENQEILVGTLRGLLWSDDFGANWSAPSSGLPTGTVTSVLWHPVRRPLMYAIQNGVVWRSTNSGSSWIHESSSDEGNNSVLELHWSAGYEKLFTVDFARGVQVQTVAQPVDVVLFNEGDQ